MKKSLISVLFLATVGCSHYPSLARLDGEIIENSRCYEDLHADIENVLELSSDMGLVGIVGYKPMHRKDGSLFLLWNDGASKAFSLFDYSVVESESAIQSVDTPNLDYLQNTTIGNLSDANCYVVSGRKGGYFFTSTHLDEMKPEDRSVIRTLLRSVP